jgi:hypothetical protein
LDEASVVVFVNFIVHIFLLDDLVGVDSASTGRFELAQLAQSILELLSTALRRRLAADAPT